jgi:Putative prokaryotic signal transducing protein
VIPSARRIAMQRVYSSPSSAEAHLVQGYLEQAGVQATVQGAELGGLLGAVPATETYASVWVADAEVEQAAGLVEEFLNSQTAEAGASLWRCPNCGEYLLPERPGCCPPAYGSHLEATANCPRKAA